MPRYTLDANQQAVLTGWLFEASQGGLDRAMNVAGVTARQALAETPTLDVEAWVRANTKHPRCGAYDWAECAAMWWLWKHSGVNVSRFTVASLPFWVQWVLDWKTAIETDYGFIALPPGDPNRANLELQLGLLTTALGAIT
jgi:hypothetical protein